MICFHHTRSKGDPYNISFYFQMTKSMNLKTNVKLNLWIMDPLHILWNYNCKVINGTGMLFLQNFIKSLDLIGK